VNLHLHSTCNLVISKNNAHHSNAYASVPEKKHAINGVRRMTHMWPSSNQAEPATANGLDLSNVKTRTGANEPDLEAAKEGTRLDTHGNSHNAN